jgi:hypothetical protein
MNPTQIIHLLTDEEGERIISLKRIQDHWSFSFRDSHYSLITDPREILDFLTGKKPVKSADKLYFWDSYPAEMKLDPEKLSYFVTMIMKEEMEKCKNDKDYFYNTYCIIKKNENNQ